MAGRIPGMSGPRAVVWRPQRRFQELKRIYLLSLLLHITVIASSWTITLVVLRLSRRHEQFVSTAVMTVTPDLSYYMATPEGLPSNALSYLDPIKC
jgi:hypothetical protein